MSSAPARDRVAQNWAARRSGRRGVARRRPATPADLVAAHTTTVARAAIVNVAPNAAAFGSGSPQHREAITAAAAAMTAENTAHVRADVDRARRRRSAAALRAALAYITHRTHNGTGDYADETAAATTALRETIALADLLACMIEPAPAPADPALAEIPVAVETWPPVPAVVLASTLTIAPGAPSLPALSAR